MIKALSLIAATSGDCSFDLGDGYSLVLKPHPLAGDNDQWDFVRGGENRGWMLVYPNYDTGPAVDKIYPGDRGLGLGRKAIKALLSYYLSLSSDPYGVTSDAAVKMWESLGAAKLTVPTNSKGFIYRVPK